MATADGTAVAYASDGSGRPLVSTSWVRAFPLVVFDGVPARGRSLSGMRIGELSRRTGVSARSLRYYEEQGLLTSSRSDAGQRHYPDVAVGRVALIRRLFDAGMSSQVIATVLPCVDVPGDLAVAEETFLAMVRERGRIDADIAHLVGTRDALDALIRVNSRHRAELMARPA